MLRSLEDLEFIESDANGFEIQMGAQGKMVQVTFDLKALQLEDGIKNGKDMVVLGDDTAHRRLSQSSILFERFVEDFHRPSFLIGR